jgi:hypothetical protein
MVNINLHNIFHCVNVEFIRNFILMLLTSINNHLVIKLSISHQFARILCSLNMINEETISCIEVMVYGLQVYSLSNDSL